MSPTTETTAPATPATTATRAGIRISPIDPQTLAELRVRDDAGRAPRIQTDDEGGSRFRCCLRSARPGERTALVAYAPLRRWARRTGAEPGPYEELGPVFIHPEECSGPGSDGAPPMEFLHSHRVLRAYDANGTILGGRLLTPAEAPDAAAAEAALAQMLNGPDVAIVHVRAVEFGCFLFEATRA